MASWSRLCLCVLFLSVSGIEAPAPLKRGDIVGTNYLGQGVWYDSVVLHANETFVTVRYDDGDIETTTMPFIKRATPCPELHTVPVGGFPSYDPPDVLVCEPCQPEEYSLGRGCKLCSKWADNPLEPLGVITETAEETWRLAFLAAGTVVIVRVIDRRQKTWDKLGDGPLLPFPLMLHLSIGLVSLWTVVSDWAFVMLGLFSHQIALRCDRSLQILHRFGVGCSSMATVVEVLRLAAVLGIWRGGENHSRMRALSIAGSLLGDLPEIGLGVTYILSGHHNKWLFPLIASSAANILLSLVAFTNVVRSGVRLTPLQHTSTHTGLGDGWSSRGGNDASSSRADGVSFR